MDVGAALIADTLDGLREGKIPDLVRLVTICDIFAALIERRPYEAPMSGAQPYAILDRTAGCLDQDLVRIFGSAAAACEMARRGARPPERGSGSVVRQTRSQAPSSRIGAATRA